VIFSTSIFVFLFLPAFLLVYYLTPFRGRSAIILVASYIFYGWWRVDFVLVLLAVSLVSYICAEITVRTGAPHIRKAALWAGVGFDLAVLGVFKYTGFLVSNINQLIDFTDLPTLTLPAIILPIGISFHTFQSISYVIDVYRKDARPARTLIDFLAFGALFPQLIAGPILRYKDVAKQFSHRIHSLEKFSRGVRQFIIGLAMKVLIADTLAPLSDMMFALEAPSLIESWLGALAYTFQLFFDFAGYSTMAIGIGLMIGFELLENFNRPYISHSITEFWQRWHISLSRWLRDYLYIPIGGNRHGSRRTYVNLIATMVLGGFWHGANWTFVIWGAWHGGLMAIERAMGVKRRASVWPSAIALPLTFLLVVIGWVIFRAPSVSVALGFYQGMIGLSGFDIRSEIYWQIEWSACAMLLIAAGLAFMPADIASRPIKPYLVTAIHSLLLVLTVSKMMAQTYSPFLYFQF
jgi:alginate O-acetyltransferase complex protein AlgI